MKGWETDAKINKFSLRQGFSELAAVLASAETRAQHLGHGQTFVVVFHEQLFAAIDQALSHPGSKVGQVLGVGFQPLEVV